MSSKKHGNAARRTVALSLLGATLTVVTATHAQVIPSAMIIHSPELQTQVNAARAAAGVPALAAAIVVDGVVFYAVSGVRRADLASNFAPNVVQRDDMFRIGSISKPYTGATFARAVETGLIQWGTTLGQVFPGSFPNANTGNAYRDVTVAQLLGHASGMWYSPPGMPAGDLSTNPFLNDYQRRGFYTTFALGDAPQFAPAQGRNYDGGAIVGTSMLETLTNTAFEATMQSQLLTPLQMTRTALHPQYTADLAPWLTAPRVLGHTGAPGSYTPNGTPTNTVRWMVGAIESSIVDMARFAYMSSYPAAAATHLYGAAQRDMLRVSVGRSDFSPAWRVVSSNAARGIELSHNGNDASSYNANMRVWPNRRVAFVTASNAFQGGGAACNAVEAWMMANAASVFTMPAGSDEIDTALSANGGATAAATGSPNSATAANVLDRSYATAWTPGAGTALALSLTPARSRTGTFPTFHRVLLDEGGFTAVAATPGASGGYGRGTHPIAQYEVRTYLLNSPFYNVIATGTGVGPQRMLEVGPQSNVARVEVVVSSTLPITLNEVHILN